MKCFCNISIVSHFLNFAANNSLENEFTRLESFKSIASLYVYVRHLPRLHLYPKITNCYRYCTSDVARSPGLALSLSTLQELHTCSRQCTQTSCKSNGILILSLCFIFFYSFFVVSWNGNLNLLSKLFRSLHYVRDIRYAVSCLLQFTRDLYIYRVR